MKKNRIVSYSVLPSKSVYNGWIELTNYTRPFSFINLVFMVLSTFVTIGVLFLPWVIINHNDDLLKNYFLFLGFGGVLLSFTYNIRRHTSEDYFKEAKEQLAKAYDIIHTENPSEITRDRLKWLTTARILNSSHILSSRIMMKSHKDLYSEEKQYWRIKFRELIGDFPHDFFDDTYEHFLGSGYADATPISDSSMIVLYRFMRWDDSYKDPLLLDKYIKLSEMEMRDMSVLGPSNLYEYLTKKDRVIEERKRVK